ncbi:dTDP-4-dehydrorhamnose reductase [Leptospira ognonensis]|uniref:dTDP-4-dehydrorhamnose reductase n=1 Tax=Leptospira ognonensis TaxID=2484945 RepID=A0A4R9K1Y8_9LEPT|nr:dTDP-4-dehydrorhamnose reductase [Leptospira ognonensis]TGL59739.1 dTDP-4-dehydrorhamnose reductase [Leptospira ognonensis]
MLNVLVTGGNGQLGCEIREVAPEFADKLRLFFVTRENLNLESESEIETFISANQIQAIVNTAAYTAVDLAEKEPEKARSSNVVIPKLLAKIANRHKIKMLHVSTDFAFDGKSGKPYKEDDLTSPISIYGKTKEEGEREVLKELPKAIILRTSWVYSKYGNNFLKTIRRLGKERPELKIIYDQIGTPTWARDLARVILKMIQTKDLSGFYHYSNEGIASWYDFAKEILDLSNLKTKILPIETSEYPTPATRPTYSVLNKKKIKQTLEIEIPHWKDSLKVCLSELD